MCKFKIKIRNPLKRKYLGGLFVYNNEHLQFKKQRLNALEILNQWEVELNMKNMFERITNLTEIKEGYDESNISNDSNKLSET